MEQRGQKYTIRDVINAARNHRNFNYAFWMDILLDILVGYVVKYFGYFLVACAFAIITSLGYSGLFIILPSLTPVWGITHITNSCLGLFILFNIYFNYIQAMMTDPGSPDPLVYGIDDEMPPQSNDPPNSGGRSNHQQYRQCKKCNVVKPPRAHHCSVCERCTLRMDHHCPWINNCVGLNNYRYFVTFLFWTSLGTLYLTLLTCPEVIKIARIELTSVLDSKDQSSHEIFSHFQNPHQLKESKKLRGHLPASSVRSISATSGKDRAGNSELIEQDIKRRLGIPHHSHAHLQRLPTTSASTKDALSSFPVPLTVNSGDRDIVSDTNGASASSEMSRKLSDRSETDHAFQDDGSAHNEASSSMIHSEQITNKGIGIHRAKQRDSHQHHNAFKQNIVTKPKQEDESSEQTTEKEEEKEDSSKNQGKFSSLWVMVIRPQLLRSVLDGIPKRYFTLLITFVGSLGVHVGVVMLFAFHLFLVVTGQTTLEFYINMNSRPPQQQQAAVSDSITTPSQPVRTPFDRGSMTANFEEVFGPYPWYIAFLPSTRKVYQMGFSSPVHPNNQLRNYSDGVGSPHPRVVGRKRADTAYGSMQDV